MAVLLAPQSVGLGLLADSPIAPNATLGHSAAHSDASVDMEGALTIMLIVGLTTMACTPLHTFIHRKEVLPPLALFLAAIGMLQLTLAYSMTGHYVAAVLMGCAFGVTNAYGTTSLWEYFYGRAESPRIKHISAAITTAASGVAIFLFGWAWQSSQSYQRALLGSSLLCFVLGVCDSVALAKPELLEGIVRRAPTWEQLLVWRQRMGYFSLVRRVRLLCGCAAAARTVDLERSLEPVHQANPIETAWKEEAD
eukprot:CAMPEP_0174744444 /NCGR_PEP_ID=MMETSP1094-20130205/84379_1 /TAXON_ID=156173 /ORGANISM="Chrysochromulina brevifilum, Strain UTEX LB 985" /LENGTH=251 /DNA_ID=CAMNT_0015948837 /DNA_START=98 /DNA_END=853 /DNA_ORIENTATION=-